MTDETKNGAGEAPLDTDLREETAAEAPELAEHDRLAELEAKLAEADAALLYSKAETQNVRRRAERKRRTHAPMPPPGSRATSCRSPTTLAAPCR